MYALQPATFFFCDIFYFMLEELDTALMQPHLLYVNWKNAVGGCRRKLKSHFQSQPDPSLSAEGEESEGEGEDISLNYLC